MSSLPGQPTFHVCEVTFDKMCFVQRVKCGVAESAHGAHKAGLCTVLRVQSGSCTDGDLCGQL